MLYLDRYGKLMYDGKTMRNVRANKQPLQGFNGILVNIIYLHQNFENRMWVYFVIFTYLKWSRWTCWRSEKRLINQIWIACKNCNCWSEVFTLRRKDVMTEQIVLFHRHPTWADFSSCWKKFPKQKIIITIKWSLKCTLLSNTSN